MKHALVPLLALTVGLAAAPASALEFNSSSTTGQSGLILPFSFETPKMGPVTVGLGLRVVPTLSTFLGPGNVTPNTQELTSSLFDGSLRVSYHQPTVDLDLNAFGRINPVIAPYVGVRYMIAPTSEGALSIAGGTAALSTSSLGGLDYGARAYTELPFGFSAQAHLGLTTLLSGSWDSRTNGLSVTSSGAIAAAGTTLPNLGAGVSWSLYNVLGFSLGYDVFALPTAMRAHTSTLAPGVTWIRGLSVGVRLLLLSF